MILKDFIASLVQASTLTKFLFTLHDRLIKNYDHDEHHAERCGIIAKLYATAPASELRSYLINPSMRISFIPNETWVEVSGKNGLTKLEYAKLENSADWEPPQPVNVHWHDIETYSLSELPWDQWLALEVDYLPGLGFDEYDALSYIIWEMTSMGITEDAINKESSYIMSLIHDVDDSGMSTQELKDRLSSKFGFNLEKS